MFNISNYFQSAKFKEQIKPIYENVNEQKEDPEMKYCSFRAKIGEIVGAAVTFYQMIMFGKDLGPEAEQMFYSYMDEVVAEYMAGQTEYRSLIEKYYLQINKDKFAGMSKEEIDKIMVTEIMDKSCMYHAFNSNFEESIKKNGISPEHKTFSQDELDRVQATIKKYPANGPFLGCQEACSGKVNYSTTPDVSLNYAYGPEWFCFFCGARSYEKNDYESAKQHIITKCEDVKMSEEDKQIVVEFFENCWEKFADFTPKLAMIPNNQMNKEAEKDFIDSVGMDPDEAWGIYSADGINCYTEETIPVDDAEIIDLPNIPQLIKDMHMEANKEKNSQLEANQQADSSPRQMGDDENVMMRL